MRYRKRTRRCANPAQPEGGTVWTNSRLLKAELQLFSWWHTTRDRRDLNLAHRLASALQERGTKVRIAPESIPVGKEWQQNLVSAILAKSTHFLVILSRASIETKWVIEEIRLARERYERDRSFRVLSLASGDLGDLEGSDFIGRMQTLPYPQRMKSP